MTLEITMKEMIVYTGEFCCSKITVTLCLQRVKKANFFQYGYGKFETDARVFSETFCMGTATIKEVKETEEFFLPQKILSAKSSKYAKK